jgi:hypothetical protein
VRGSARPLERNAAGTQAPAVFRTAPEARERTRASAAPLVQAETPEAGYRASASHPRMEAGASPGRRECRSRPPCSSRAKAAAHRCELGAASQATAARWSIMRCWITNQSSLVPRPTETSPSSLHHLRGTAHNALLVCLRPSVRPPEGAWSWRRTRLVWPAPRRTLPPLPQRPEDTRMSTPHMCSNAVALTRKNALASAPAWAAYE